MFNMQRGFRSIKDRIEILSNIYNNSIHKVHIQYMYMYINISKSCLSKKIMNIF